jgi:hypothetical protein
MTSLRDSRFPFLFSFSSWPVKDQSLAGHEEKQRKEK